MNYKEKLKNITTFVFDYDGVLSDGKIWMTKEGDQIRNTCVRDGYAIQYALKKGYNIAVVSRGRGDSMINRMNYLGVKDIFTGISDKKEKIAEYIIEKEVAFEEILYMGDDIPDYEAIRMAGLGCCPADAATEIKEIAGYISKENGGAGCVRDVIEQVMRAQNKWMQEDAFYL